MTRTVEQIVLCNGATLPAEAASQEEPIRLDYRRGQNQNVRIEIPDFVQTVHHLPDRFLDLLEIAAYIYCADRYTTRGPKDAVEYHKWSRSFHFHIKVRDFDFWRQFHVVRLLNETLSFLSGDRQFAFTFSPGHRTPPADLFDRAEFSIASPPDTRVVLFSGGLDSLTGVVELLTSSTDKLCLVSHRSGQPGTGRTQDQLFRALVDAHANRLQHFKFRCGLTGARAAEETQRARMFLYSSIAVCLCVAISQHKFHIFENGITSLNFAKRQDLLNGRATRTTHPKTIWLLERLFSEIVGRELAIDTPFLWKTKADVFAALGRSGQRALISSAVSCSKTFLNLEQASHCGGCSQCIDRRIAAYAAGLEELDEAGIYAFDFIRQAITDGEVRSTVIDYIRQARDFAEWNADHFYTEMLNELTNVVDFVGAATDDDANLKIWELCKRHGTQVMEALARIRNKHDALAKKIPDGSLLKLIADRDYLKSPTSLAAENRLVCPDCGQPIPEPPAKALLGSGAMTYNCLCGATVPLREPDGKVHFRPEASRVTGAAGWHWDLDAFVMSAKGETNTKSFQEWAGGDRVTLAIVFTDVVGSTAMGEEIRDESMNEVRRAHFAQSRKLIDKFKGREIKTIGDSFMAAFKCVNAALDYARALQQSTGHPQVDIRAGIHIGAMQVEEDDVFGGTVNFAARVIGAIQGAEVWLSDRAKEDIDRLGAAQHKDLKWEQHEGVGMKGFPGEVTLWSLKK